VLSRLALIFAVALVGSFAAGSTRAEQPPRWHAEPIEWKQSRSLGKPWAGRLVNGVRLPSEGETYFTWDPVLKTVPNRPWRRWGSERLLRTIFRVLDQYVAANPEAPRVAIGDLSRPKGGIFDERFGGKGHASHQNGLDVDVYYPRLDREERAPRMPAEVDRALSQQLVSLFVRAGAVKVFVGPRVGLRGPRRIVQALWNHDDHMHVRIAGDRPRTMTIGRSHGGRPIRAVRAGDPSADTTFLIVGCIHGDECEGTKVTRRLERAAAPLDLWLVHQLNPDGYARRHRQNGRGVDLNRNFDSEWRPIGRRWSPQYSGPRPFSERESRIARRLILSLRPDVTIWFHQPQAIVRAWGPSIPEARRYAGLAREPFRALRWPVGTAPNWQNRLFPGKPSFVVELPPGRLSAPAAARHARAILALSQ
jgi:murein endopeptidase